MPLCFVLGCKANNFTEKQKLKHTYVRFPPEKPDMRERWFEACGREAYIVNGRICSSHFKKSCFKKVGKATVLKDDAIPTENLPSQDLIVKYRLARAQRNKEKGLAQKNKKFSDAESKIKSILKVASSPKSTKASPRVSTRASTQALTPTSTKNSNVSEPAIPESTLQLIADDMIETKSGNYLPSEVIKFIHSNHVHFESAAGVLSRTKAVDFTTEQYNRISACFNPMISNTKIVSTKLQSAPNASKEIAITLNPANSPSVTPSKSKLTKNMSQSQFELSIKNALKNSLVPCYRLSQSDFQTPEDTQRNIVLVNEVVEAQAKKIRELQAEKAKLLANKSTIDGLLEKLEWGSKVTLVKISNEATGSSDPLMETDPLDIEAEKNQMMSTNECTNQLLTPVGHITKNTTNSPIVSGSVNQKPNISDANFLKFCKNTFNDVVYYFISTQLEAVRRN